MPLHLLPSAPTDFDFVIGDWSVKHRRLEQRLVNCQDWIEFDGEMTTHKILGGFGNVEYNRLQFPDGDFRRAIWWLDGRCPDRLDVPVKGRFKDGVGSFFAEDTLNGIAIKARFLWSRSDPDTLRREQEFSVDEGRTWETNWTMDFSRTYPA